MSPGARLLVFLIGLYRRWVSPALPRRCRYEPTCSRYAADAVRTHGAWRGSWMAIRRIGRCHPWSDGGVDRVPARRSA